MLVDFPDLSLMKLVDNKAGINSQILKYGLI